LKELINSTLPYLLSPQLGTFFKCKNSAPQ